MMPRLNNRILVIVVCLAVVAVIIGGFMLAGSPQMARQQQVDMIRSNNLQQIASIIDSYYYQVKTLPESLSALYQASNDGTGFSDPVTGQPYTYSIITDTQYQLCASFDQMSDDNATIYQPQPSDLPNFYQHGVGNTCFTITIPNSATLPTNLPVK